MVDKLMMFIIAGQTNPLYLRGLQNIAIEHEYKNTTIIGRLALIVYRRILLGTIYINHALALMSIKL